MANRRSVLSGLGALPFLYGLGGVSHAGARCSGDIEGVPLYSESVHTGVVSVDGRFGMNARLCRYPSLGMAWVWVHAYTPSGFYAFTDHCAPCGPSPVDTAAGRARFVPANENLVSFDREGPGASPVRAAIKARVRVRPGRDARHGRGTLPLSVSLGFTAQRRYEGLLPGRTEVFGWSRVALTLNGETITFEGPAQFHEQVQSAPRFTRAFTYVSLWGQTKASTALLLDNTAPGSSGGYLLEGSVGSDLSAFAISPPGPERTLVMTLKDGSRIETTATRRQAYAIPVFGRTWLGSMVNVPLGDQTLYGNVNDYMPDRLPYSR